MLNSATAVDIVSSYNRCIASVDETNRGLVYVAPVRHSPEMFDHRNRILNEMMNHQSHQAEY